MMGILKNRISVINAFELTLSIYVSKSLTQGHREEREKRYVTEQYYANSRKKAK